MTAEPKDDPRTLLRKAAEDEAAVRALAGHDEIDDALLGFHAQQAVEKSIKAVLASAGVEYPLTHDIARLIELLEEVAIEVTFSVQDAIDLTGWGAVYRYSDPIDENLDRADALRVAEVVRAWAESQLGDR